ncbi:hypothetical protein MIR68_005162 [Amoeboaphelidium protococcarum]|nr:hypothetical protein MIR68_005162 [Amoeboaphelidium protococcarum]
MEVASLIVYFYIGIMFALLYVWVLAPVFHSQDSYCVRLHIMMTSPDCSNWLYTLIRRIFGQYVADCSAGAFNYTFKGRNPFIQIFFTVLYVSCVSLFIYSVYLPYIADPSDGIDYGFSELHIVVVPASIILVYFFYYAACTVSPGYVTSENVEQILEHPTLGRFDEILFYSNTPPCRTCHTVKPARSKHCSLCGGCVMVYDHHCVWLNQCVGYFNRRWFLYFLSSLLAICLYGVYLMSSIIYNMLYISYEGEGTGLISRRYWDDASASQQVVGISIGLLIVLSQHVFLVALDLFVAIVSVIVALFLLFHLYLIARGTTTNELGKWDDIDDEIQQKWIEGPARYKQEMKAIKAQGGYSAGILTNFYLVFYPDYALFEPDPPQLLAGKSKKKL